jgi:hypothetical protein
MHENSKYLQRRLDDVSAPNPSAVGEKLKLRLFDGFFLGFELAKRAQWRGNREEALSNDDDGGFSLPLEKRFAQVQVMEKFAL